MDRILGAEHSMISGSFLVTLESVRSKTLQDHRLYVFGLCRWTRFLLFGRKTLKKLTNFNCETLSMPIIDCP